MDGESRVDRRASGGHCVVSDLDGCTEVKVEKTQGMEHVQGNVGESVRSFHRLLLDGVENLAALDITASVKAVIDVALFKAVDVRDDAQIRILELRCFVQKLHRLLHILEQKVKERRGEVCLLLS